MHEGKIEKRIATSTFSIVDIFSVFLNIVFLNIVLVSLSIFKILVYRYRLINLPVLVTRHLMYRSLDIIPQKGGDARFQENPARVAELAPKAGEFRQKQEGWHVCAHEKHGNAQKGLPVTCLKHTIISYCCITVIRIAHMLPILSIHYLQCKIV